MSEVKAPKATSAIVVSNPVKKRFVTPPVTSSKPEIKIVFTVTEEDPLQQSKPRSRARKSDLAKCVSDFNKATSSSNSSNNKPSEEPFIILGGNKDTGDIDSLLSETFSIPKLLGDGDVVFVQCPECNKKLKQKSYRSHLRTHLGFKQFRCELCGDRFTRKNDVKRHMKLIHEKPRNFQCDECEKYFLTEDNLRTHQEKHSRELKCRKCQHMFGKAAYYSDHIKYVHPDGGPDCSVEGEKADPAILRRLEKRRSSSLEEPGRPVKLLMLGGSPGGSPGEETGTAGSARSLPTCSSSSSSGTDQQDTKTARLGQLVQMPDGTFIIVDCDDECEATDDHDQSQVSFIMTRTQYISQLYCRTLSRHS